jgi:hypothetical protein
LNALGRGTDDMPGIERAGCPFEQSRPIQQRPPPAAAVQHWLDRSRYVAESGHERGDIEQPGMIGDQHGRPLWQLT